MPYGWEGSKVRLVPLDKAKHFENSLVWMNDPELTAWLILGDFPLANLAQEKWFEERMAGGKPEQVVFAVETLEGEHVGFSGVERIDYRHGTAITGTLLGRKDLWGQGLGTDAARVRKRYAFEVLGLRLLLSDVMAENVASIRMLQKIGYREVGRIPRRWWKRGAWRDSVMLACERESVG